MLDVIERRMMTTRFRALVRDMLPTPQGMFHFVAAETGVIYAGWSLSDEFAAFVDNHPTHPTAKDYADWTKEELLSYFRGDLQNFTVPVVAHGTDFQARVWDALKRIPYGTTCAYRDIAKDVGSPKAVRAIGQANRANRIAVIVPCHRVIGANGGLVGYAGHRTEFKSFLLELEQQSLGQASLTSSRGKAINLSL